MSICNYKNKYFDYDKKETLEFNCKKEARTTGFCLFHDDTCKNDDEIINGLESIINETLSKHEPLFCIGYNIPKIKMKKSFSETAYFTRAKFKNSDFTKIKFKKVDFSGAKFQNANFSETEFDEADFIAVDFNEEANFPKAIFKNKVNFSESKFKDVDFSESRLNQAHFLGTEFKAANFDLAQINNSDFFGAKFEGQANFIGSEINRTSFNNTKFQKKANFNGSKIKKTHFPQTTFVELDFGNATIQNSNWQRAIIQGNANFISSNIDKVYFLKVNFKKNANFSESILHEVAFAETKFDGITNFVKTLFDEVKFNKSELNEVDFTKSKFKNPTFFNEAVFKKQDRVFFNVEDLSKVSFMFTDISKVKFGENVKWGGKNNFYIIDEKFLENSTDKSKIESVIATYRNLRKNYENRFRYEEACKFFEREIVLRKMLTDNISDLSNLEMENLEEKIQELVCEFDELKKKFNPELLKKHD